MFFLTQKRKKKKLAIITPPSYVMLHIKSHEDERAKWEGAIWMFMNERENVYV